MKKTWMILLAAAAMLLLGISASAQVSIGAGPAARLFFPQGKDVITAYGVQVSFEDSNRLSDVIGFSAGVDFGTYIKKDYSIRGNDVQDLTEMYVDIPVRLKFYIPFSDSFQLFIFGGPVPSARVGSHLKTGDEKQSRIGENATYNWFDLLAGGGIGFEIAEHFKLAFGYDHGLLNQYKSESVKVHAGAAKVTAAFMF